VLVAFRDRLLATIRAARPELRHVIISNLTILSLMEARPGMPDPEPRRGDVAALLRRLEGGSGPEP
jgi:hypothetical protein